MKRMKSIFLLCALALALTACGAQQPGTDAQMISEEAATQVALDHAGLTAEEVTFAKIGLDLDDGRRCYDLEFYTSDFQEYDYEIDPYTGEILSYDRDAEFYAPDDPGVPGDTAPVTDPTAPADPAAPAGPAAGGEITPDAAKEIALAKVPGAAAGDIRQFETDYDDGRLQYEGSIFYEQMEYEFEIDGQTGNIIGWEVESIFD